MQQQDSADKLAVHHPGHGVREVEAGLERAPVVGLVGVEHRGAQAFERIRHAAAQVGVVRQVGVCHQQDGQRPPRALRGLQRGQQPLLRARRRAIGALLGVRCRPPGPLRFARAGAEAPAQLEERVAQRRAPLHCVCQA